MKMAYQYFPVLYYSTFKQPYMCTVPMLSISYYNENGLSIFPCTVL